MTRQLIKYIYIFFSTFLIIECRKVTIIVDSIAKNLYGMDGVTLQIFCGDTIAKIAPKIDSGEARLDPFDFVIIHVGTNDIDNRAPFLCCLSFLCSCRLPMQQGRASAFSTVFTFFVRKSAF